MFVKCTKSHMRALADTSGARLHRHTLHRITFPLSYLHPTTQRPSTFSICLSVSLSGSALPNADSFLICPLSKKGICCLYTGLSWLCGVLVEVLLLLDTGRPTVLQDAAAGHRHRTGSLGLVQQTEVSAAVQR